MAATSMKKLEQGDCSWGTIKEVLGWIIDTVNMTIHLPDRRVEQLASTLDADVMAEIRDRWSSYFEKYGY